MSTPQLNSNILALLKKMATDPTFLESLEKAKSPADGKAIMSQAGIKVDFTKNDVVTAIQSLTQPTTGGSTPPKTDGSNEAWVAQLAKVSGAVIGIMFPA